MIMNFYEINMKNENIKNIKIAKIYKITQILSPVEKVRSSAVTPLKS